MCLLFFLVNWPNSSSPDADEGAGKKRFSRLSIPLLAVMFVLWANLHGAVIIGLIVLAITAICDLLQDRMSPSSRRLVMVGMLCAAAVCLNPYGIGYWTALRSIQTYTFSLLLEWKPPFAAPMLAVDMIGNAAVLLLVALVAWGMNPQRRWSQLAWLIVMGALFLQARRNLWLLNLTSLAVIAANAALLDTRRLWQEWQSKRAAAEAPEPVPARSKKARKGEPVPIVEAPVYEVPERLRRIAQAAVVGCFLLWIGLKLSEVWPIQAVSRQLPLAKVAFIRDRNLQGRAFNSIEDSPYLEWRTGGKPPLFIDILNAYPDQVTQDYGEIIAGTPRGRALLSSHDIRYIILATAGSREVPSKLVLWLEGQSRWKLIYTDVDGMIWERQAFVVGRGLSRGG